MRSLSLKKLFFLISLMALIGGVVIALVLWQVTRQNAEVRSAWLEFQREMSQHQRLENSLYHALGYGGLFHNTTNLILRGEPQYRAAVIADIGATRLVLDAMNSYNPSDAEAQALKILGAFVDRVAASPETILAQREGGVPLGTLFDSTGLSDQRVVRAIITLEQENRQRAKRFGEGRSKIALVTQIRSRQGLTGMIYNFKRFVITGAKDSHGLAAQRIQQIQETIDAYSRLPISRSEEIALEDLSAVVDSYSAMLDMITELRAQGMAVVEIDQAVRVDDVPALRALTMLERAVAREVDGRAENLAMSLNDIKKRELQVLAGVLLLFGGFSVSFLWLTDRLALRPVQRLSNVIDDIAHENLDVSVPYRNRPNEIGRMARAVAVFRDVMERHAEAEQELEISNEELNYQLASLREMRDRSEEQASRAMATAQELAAAKESADEAMRYAEAEHRKLSSILTTMTDALITSDSQGQIETFNPAAERMFGFSAQEVVGRNIGILMSDAAGDDHDQYMRDYLSGNARREPNEVRELVARRKGGREFPVELAIGSMLIGEETKFTGLIRDITDRKKSEEEIRRLALTDALTGLANRNQFMQKLEDAVKHSRRRKEPFALLLLDLDKFKPVNDTYGHPVGDALLVDVAETLMDISRDVDTVARLGGDEFAIILTEIEGLQSVRIPSSRIITALCTPMQVMGHKVQIGTSIGVALYPDDSTDVDELIVKADMALYAAKDAGRNTYRVYSELRDGKAGSESERRGGATLVPIKGKA